MVKSWNIKVNGKENEIKLVHSWWSGKREVFLNGIRVTFVKNNFLDMGSVHVIEVDRHPYIVEIKIKGLMFSYSLYPLIENTNIIEDFNKIIKSTNGRKAFSVMIAAFGFGLLSNWYFQNYETSVSHLFWMNTSIYVIGVVILPLIMLYEFSFRINIDFNGISYTDWKLQRVGAPWREIVVISQGKVNSDDFLLSALLPNKKLLIFDLGPGQKNVVEYILRSSKETNEKSAQ